MFFADSYISLDTILFEKWIIKQYSRGVYSISTKGKTENINLWDYRLFKYITRIKSDLWIEIDDNWIRKATLERAILDSIYFKFFSWNYPWENELYLFAINNEKMNKLLEIYPKRVQDYYLKLVNR